MTTQLLTYKEFSEAFGIKIESARRLVTRKKWEKAKGIDGLARIHVPDEYLAKARDNSSDTPNAIPEYQPKDKEVAALKDELSRLHARTSALEEKLAGSQELLKVERERRKEREDEQKLERDAWHQRQKDIESERDAWRGEATKSLLARLFSTQRRKASLSD